MNKLNQDANCEHSEQSEQTTWDDGSNSAHQNHVNANSSNIIPIEAIKPVDISPTILVETDIKRPCYESHRDWFQISGRKYPLGVYWHGISNKGDVDDFICSPLTVEAVTSNKDCFEFGRLLKFIDTNGTWHEWAMPMRMLKGSGEDLISELLDQGLIFDNKRKNQLINYIMSAKPKNRIIATSTIGWDNNVFVLPTTVIGDDSEIIFQSESTTENDFKTSGSLDEWQRKIGTYCIGNTPLIVSVSAALAGPLLMLLNRQQGGGIHWVGDSSCGKSTCLEVAASVWGSSNFIRSWSATANGIEGIVSTRNDTCILLDEIDEALPNDISKIIYMLANGQGKQRASRAGMAKKIQRWRTIALSTGERTLSSIMNDIQKQPNSGQLVRLLNISADFKFGMFNNLHEISNGRELSDYLKSQRLKYYGTLGPAFIKQLINNKNDAMELYNDIVGEFSNITANKLEERAASTMSLIATAGEQAIQFKILPWPAGSVLEACIEAFGIWKRDSIGVMTETDKILQLLRTFIDKNCDSRFSHINSSTQGEKTFLRAGWYKDLVDGRTYMFLGYALDEAGGKFERNRVIKALKQANWLAEYSTGRNTKRTRVNGILKDLYYIRIPDENDV